MDYRYRDPRGRVLAQVDSVLEVGARDASEGKVTVGGIAAVRGWAADAAARRPVDALTIAVGGGIAVRAVLGFAQDCAIENAASDGASGLGFVAAVPVDAPAGSQPIVIEALVGDRWIAVENACSVEVVPPTDPFDGLRARREHWRFDLEGVYVEEFSQAPREGVDWILDRGKMGHIRLWALDTLAGAPVRDIVARAGGTYFPAVAGFEAPYVAAAAGSAGAQRCGFAIPVMAPLVGTHTIQIFALAADGETYGALCTVRVRSPEPLGLDALPSDGGVLGTLDRVIVDGAVVDHDDAVNVPRGAAITLDGWAVDRRGPRLASAIELSIPGAGTFEATYGMRRLDVAQALHGAVNDCGFSLTVASGRLEPGAYRASLRALGARRDAFTEFRHVDLVVH